MASIDDAHAGLLKHAWLQFDFPDAAATPAVPAERWTPRFDWAGQTLGWVVVAVAAVLALVIVWRAVRQRRIPPADPPASPDPVIPASIARATLAKADALASAGRFTEAAHALLACGIDTIEQRFPALLRPATTSRDLVERAGLPDTLRTAFAAIAATVEKGIFGGRAVTAADYAACRAAFATSALAGRS